MCTTASELCSAGYYTLVLETGTNIGALKSTNDGRGFMLLFGAVVTSTSDDVLMSIFAFFFKSSWRATL
jgi:hypothetical protein